MHVCSISRCIILFSDIRNEVFALTLVTANSVNQTVGCALLLGGTGKFECEFCYSTDTSCLNLTCITVGTSAAILPSLTEVTHCYRVTAKVNGNPVAVIQGTFSVGK